MVKNFHEIRDPIHTFIYLDSYERKVLDSRPFQRLRNITQLALTYLLYPGATHKRFEHSLGVMEIAGRVFDVLTKDANVTDAVKELLPDLGNPSALTYWKRCVRMAALCHDIGHFPFSHAADQLLPPGWNHERMSRILIESDEMRDIWDAMVPPVKPEHVVKLALGEGEAKDMQFTKWESILSEIIVGDAFGVDRIDYLLRDSHHTGVAYGKFDHYRLIDELRILPSYVDPTVPALGINGGGIYSAEALALARYFMFSQVYYHPVRLIYDRHLLDFLGAWLSRDNLIGEGTFSTMIEDHLRMTDDEVNAAMRAACLDSKAPGHRSASCIMKHCHYRVLYQRNPQHAKVNSAPGLAIEKAAVQEFGTEAVRYSKPPVKGVAVDFPVCDRDGGIQPAVSVSETLSKLRPTSTDYVFIDPEIETKAKARLKKNADRIVEVAREEDEDDEHETGPKTSSTDTARP